VLYLVFGINRIERKAKSLRRAGKLKPESVGRFFRHAEEARLGEHVPEHIAQIAELGNRLTAHSLTAGNLIEPLVNGDAAFPAMLEAIELAQKSIALCSYIFDNDSAGRKFVDALDAAHRRGVEVRVLIDAVGSRYSWMPAVKLLRERNVPAALFNPTFGFTHFVYANLRNHRKIMVVDGRTGFTGGMNIRAGNVLAEENPHPIQDVHFRLRGPVVNHLQSSFASDWEFATHEILEGSLWFPQLEAAEHMIARGVSDGPDADLDKQRLVFLAAVSGARERILITTPYFLPDETLIDALNVASLRGVEVDVVIPAENNLRTVGYAAMATIPYVLARGCRVWLSPPPFDHSKLMIVDGTWSCFGSANWDSRSLRLNFEYNVECYDRDLAEELTQIVEAKIAAARAYTISEADKCPRIIRLRNGAARMLSPYL